MSKPISPRSPRSPPHSPNPNTILPNPALVSASTASKPRRSVRLMAHISGDDSSSSDEEGVIGASTLDNGAGPDGIGNLYLS